MFCGMRLNKLAKKLNYKAYIKSNVDIMVKHGFILVQHRSGS